MLMKLTCVAFLTAFITACGGGSGSGGEDNSTTAIGQFKDANVEGLVYASGNESGITDSIGNFTYEKGNTVTFSIGAVEIGVAQGNSIVTPIDLVVNGTSNDIEVQNIVRFLLLLDEDADASNGIVISPAIQALAENWSQIDFTTTDLDSELTDVLSDVASVIPPTLLPISVPDAVAAKNHLEATLRCVYAGAFRGSFSGTDSGSFGILLDASNGSLSGVAYSTVFSEFYRLSGVTPISFDSIPYASFVTGDSSGGSTFSGQFSNPNNLSGTWGNISLLESGDFSGSRIGGLASAAYRFTGTYEGSDFGLFSFDIDNSNNVSGVGYSVADDELFSLSGFLTGTTLSVTTEAGSIVEGVLDTALGTITNGVWQNLNEGLSGSFSGSGCRLN